METILNVSYLANCWKFKEKGHRFLYNSSESSLQYVMSLAVCYGRLFTTLCLMEMF